MKIIMITKQLFQCNRRRNLSFLPHIQVLSCIDIFHRCRIGPLAHCIFQFKINFIFDLQTASLVHGYFQDNCQEFTPRLFGCVCITRRCKQECATNRLCDRACHLWLLLHTLSFAQPGLPAWAMGNSKLAKSHRLGNIRWQARFWFHQGKLWWVLL